MTEWTLVHAEVPGSVPVTNLYRSETGHYVLVSVLNFITARGTEVCLSRPDCAVLDPQTGEVADSVVAMLTLPEGTTFDEALALIDVDALPPPPPEPEPEPEPCFHLGYRVATRGDLPQTAPMLAVWAVETGGEFAAFMGDQGWQFGPWTDAEPVFHTSLGDVPPSP